MDPDPDERSRADVSDPDNPKAQPGATGAWIRFGLPALLFLATLVVYAATVSASSVNTDAYSASVSAWRIATTGHPWMEGVDTSQLRGAEILDSWIVTGADGHLVHNRMPGVVLPAVPFYWLLANDSDPSHFSITPGGLAGATLASGAVVLIFLTLRRHVSQALALAGAAVFAFATPTWSVSANGLWTHSVTQFALAGAAWSLRRHRWLAVGVWIGIGMLARPHLAVIAAVVGLGMAWARRDKWIAVAVATPALTSLAALLCWNRVVFGRWGIQGGYGDYVTNNLTTGAGGSGQLSNVAGFLISPDRGLFVWTPLLLVLLPAVVRSWRELPGWTRWLALGGVAYTLVQLRLNSFTGGLGYYGYRHGLELLTCLTPAIVLSVAKTGRVARFLTPPLIGLQFAAMSLGATIEGFFVLLPDVWHNNSYWLAFREQPFVVGIFAAVCIVAGALVAVRLERQRSTRSGEVTAATASG